MSYQTDDEQLELVKKWWRDYGWTTVIAIVLALIVGLGWRFWQNRLEGERIEASFLYQSFLQAQQKNQLPELQRVSTQLTTSYPRTPYASAAMFKMAQRAVQSGHLEEAIQDLNWVAQKGHDDAFKQLARLRLARIALAQNKPDEALAYLKGMKDDEPFVAEMMGDAYFALKQFKEAAQFYQKGLDHLDASDSSRNLLNLKLNQAQTLLASL